MATSNLTEFVVGIDRYVDEEVTAYRDRFRAVCLYALRQLVLGTRYDTGRARGNWQTAEGDPPEGFDPDLYDKEGGQTIDSGARVIGQANGDRVIWLHNGVPYFVYIEALDKVVVGTKAAVETWLEST